MTEVLHANIFFFIASVAVVLFVILVAIALYHVIKIVASLRRIVERVELGSERIVEDVEEVRKFVRDTNPIAQLLRFAMSFRNTNKSGRARKRTKVHVQKDE